MHFCFGVPCVHGAVTVGQAWHTAWVYTILLNPLCSGAALALLHFTGTETGRQGGGARISYFFLFFFF